MNEPAFKQTGIDEEESLGVIGPRSVHLERLLPGPAERVWAYLTEPEKRAKWMAHGSMSDHVGGPITLVFHTVPLGTDSMPERFKEFEGSVLNCTITRYEPPHVLAYTWGDAEDASEVIMEIKPAPKGARPGSVLLSVVHRQTRDRKQMLSVSTGWHTHLGVLMDELNGNPQRPFWSRFIALEAEYDKRIPGLG